jgi:hypothetical protein
VITLVFTILLVLAISPIKVNMSTLHQAVYSVQSTTAEVSELSDSHGVVVNVNQAVNFNHLNQLLVDYTFVSLLVIFFIFKVNYRYFKSKILLPPWYIILKKTSRMSLSGWKVSNILYKSKWLYKF